MKNDRDGYRRLLTPTPRCFLEGFESWEEAFGRGTVSLGVTLSHALESLTALAEEKRSGTY